MKVQAASQKLTPMAATPRPAPAQPQQPDPPAPLDRVELEGFSSSDQFTIEINGQKVATVVGDNPGLLQRFGVGAQRVIGAASRELVGVTSADPAFAFAQTARGVKPLVLQDMPPEFQQATEQYFVPLLRAVQIGFNVKRFIDRWRARKETPQTLVNEVGTAINGAHIVTDALGLVGALGTVVPALSAVSTPCLTVAVAGDIAAFSYNMLEYVQERGEQPPEPPTS